MYNDFEEILNHPFLHFSVVGLKWGAPWFVVSFFLDDFKAFGWRKESYDPLVLWNFCCYMGCLVREE